MPWRLASIFYFSRKKVQLIEILLQENFTLIDREPVVYTTMLLRGVHHGSHHMHACLLHSHAEALSGIWGTSQVCQQVYEKTFLENISRAHLRRVTLGLPYAITRVVSGFISLLSFLTLCYTLYGVHATCYMLHGVHATWRNHRQATHAEPMTILEESVDIPRAWP